MSCSRSFAKFQIRITIFFIRLIGWLQSGDMKKNKLKGEFVKADILTNYVAKKYLPVVKSVEQKEITVTPPEIIWQFWDNPNGKTTPEIVISCLKSVDKFKGNFEHRILTKSTMENFSDLPNYVLDKFKKEQIDYTHFSDLLRLNLLKNHGGIWLDATGYMTDFVPKYILDEDFFVFLTGELTHFPYSYMQSCFIRTKKGSFLCDAWHEMSMEYWKKETKKLEYFQIHLMFKALVEKNPVAKDLFDKMPHISEDEIQQLVGSNLLKKFDIKEWERIKETSFIQKTTYKIPIGINYSDTYFSKLSEGEI
ncbi:MAG: capsular polysaccharide synthesis protein [Chitinispirillales bacterium]|jgi:hypothetical protein|nr:capsular polysaccharide synthesis protein [Chitinispirillales bacterium]